MKPKPEFKKKHAKITIKHPFKPNAEKPTIIVVLLTSTSEQSKFLAKQKFNEINIH